MKFTENIQESVTEEFINMIQATVEALINPLIYQIQLLQHNISELYNRCK